MCSGGSKGGARDIRPLWGPKFFQFHAVFGKIWQNRMLAPPPGSWRPLLGEILDPPLVCPDFNARVDPTNVFVLCISWYEGYWLNRFSWYDPDSSAGVSLDKLHICESGQSISGNTHWDSFTASESGGGRNIFPGCLWFFFDLFFSFLWQISVQFCFSFPCSFRQKNYANNRLTPPLGLAAPSGKFWICQCTMWMDP